MDMAPRIRSTHLIMILTVLGLAACGGSPGAVPSAREAEQIEGDVRATLEAYQEAIAQRDSAQIVALLAPDLRFRWLEDGRQAYRSPDQVIAGLRSIPAESSIETIWSNPDVTAIRSDIALVATEFSTTVMAADSTGQGFSFSGVISMVLELGPDGWRIVVGHTSTPPQP